MTVWVKVRELEDERDELRNALSNMVCQHCTSGVGDLDSMALSDNADAMRLLARLGQLTITAEHGRRVIGRWVR